MTATVILVEVTVTSPAGADSVLRFADRAIRPFPPTDATRANAAFDERLIEPPTLRRALFDDLATLGPSLGAGIMTLANADRALDAYQGYVWGEISVLRWTEGAAFSAAEPIIAGFCAPPSFDHAASRPGRVKVALYDERIVLQNPLQATNFLGTNASGSLYEGEVNDLKGKPLPLAYGRLTAAQIPAPKANNASYAYKLNDGPINPSVTRALSAAYYDSQGVVRQAAADVARWTYDPTNLALPPTLLLEASATNLLLRSQQFTNGVWTPASGAAVADNVVLAPDGTMTGARITFSGANASRLEQTTSTAAVAGQQVTGSVWLKGVGTCRITANTSTGVGGSAEPVINLPAAWTRYQVAFTVTAAPTGNLRFFPAIWRTGDTATEVDVWGAQLELGSLTATSYITTLGAAVTRPADVIALAVNVFDRGDSAGLTSDGNKSGAAFDAWSPVAAHFVTDFARGLLKFNSTPVGITTFGYYGNAGGGQYAETTGPILARILTKAGVAPARIGASVSGFAATAPIGVYVADASPAADVAAVVSRSGLAALLPDRSGVWQAHALAPPAAVADFALVEDQVIDIKADETAPLPAGDIRVGWGRKYQVFTGSELAPALRNTASEAALADEWRWATATDATVKARLPGTWRKIEIQTALQVEGDAIAAASSLKTLFALRPDGKPRRQWRVTVELTAAALALALGKTVSLTYPALGLNGALFLFVAEEPMRPRRDQAIWTLWG